MIKLTLKDGSNMEVENGSSILDVAKKISEGLARVATAGMVNGEVKDLRYKLIEDCELNILTFDALDGKKAYWHTTSHVLAQAVKRLYPDTKLTIGPSIENGFYYDFDSETRFTPEILEKLEVEMKKIVKENIEIKRFTLSREEAIKFMQDKNETYKVELIEELPEGEEISFYEQGDFVDLCAGPHLMTTGTIKAIKLLSVSGAYWRGNEKNKMLQRIYGISFPKKADLEEHLQLLEEAKERDHRKIGKDLDLFMFSELVGKGLPMWLPNGFTLRRTLSDYIMDKEIAIGYKHVLTPSLGNVNLYKTSGHWDHYKEDMFPAMEMEDEAYVLRPMNCPHHMMMFKNAFHSYRDLPVRIAEIASDFRYEASGTLTGIERTRAFYQNDSHIFCRPDQIKEEFKSVANLILDVYKDFGFENYSFRLSLRDKNNPEKYFQNDELWEKSENELRAVLNDMGVDYYEAEGEAAFYGPKLDVQVKSAIGHDVTLSTIQLDYQLPEKFDLEYIGEDGEKHKPVVIHRAILGSLDRFIAFLIEETKGNFPLWLAPRQAIVLPISDKQAEYAKKVEQALLKEKIRTDIDLRNEKVGYKIREAQLAKIPYMIVVGEKEAESNMVAIRSRKDGDLGQMNLDELITKLKEEIENR